MRRIKQIVWGLMGALAVLGIVVAWPDLELILTIGAAVLVISAYSVAIIWTDRRRRRGEEASTANPNNILPPMSGWSGGGGF